MPSGISGLMWLKSGGEWKIKIRDKERDGPDHCVLIYQGKGARLYLGKLRAIEVF